MLIGTKRPLIGDEELLSARVRRHLERQIASDERALVCLRGRFEQSVIVYADRLVIVKPRSLTGGAFSTKVTTLYLHDVSGIQVHTGLLESWIEVTSAGFTPGRSRSLKRPAYERPNCIVVRRRRLASYSPALEELRLRIVKAKTTAERAQSQDPERVLSELERLGALRLAGVLSQSEFERAKRLLLERPAAA